ncbi:ABC transporter substrate-binding protein [Halorussus amylolyticus]|uniref:ABC transporter substrate-binding protein n=1 Tax=Halorussus amylolyticus TaxID=1126242 RepID=UPI00192F9AF0|nr:ABC transporter substrate-binding protein [Halorussus amylolyticus]
MDETVSRRRWLTALGATGAAGLAGCMGGDEGAQDTTTGDDATTETDSGMTETTAQTTTQAETSGTVKIGVLQPTSGDLSYYGEQSLWGFYSGLAYKAGTDPIESASTGTHTVSVGDVEYELIVRDTGFAADQAQSLATDLVQNEEVDMLVGCASSGAANRVINTVVTQAQVPYMVAPAASADITTSSETCNNLVFRASENTAMDARSGGKYVANETDVSSVYLFGADYSFGRAVVSNYKQVLEDEGVEILDEKFVPQGYSEWEGLLDNAQEAGAEGIVGGFTVATLPNLFTSFLNGDYDYRVFGGLATQITNSVVGQTLEKALGDLTEEKISEAKVGPLTTRYHWNQYDNDINSEFVETYTSTYGVVPDLFTSGSFTAASAIAQAVEETGSTDGRDIAEGLRGMTVSATPKGEDGYTFQEYNNQARSAMTVADLVPTSDEWADSWDAAVMPGEPLSTIGEDETTIPQDSDQMGCSL